MARVRGQKKKIALQLTRDPFELIDQVKRQVYEAELFFLRAHLCGQFLNG